MKAKIDKNGDLVLARGGSDQDQLCPYGNIDHCGDWCPLFGEPQVIVDRPDRPKFTRLVLCRREWVFKEFEDERGTGNE